MKDFGVNPGQRVDVLIDGPSFYATTRSLGYEVDYKKFRDHFDEVCDLHRIYYFTAITDNPDDHSPVKPLVDWLGYNGFRTITKPLREFIDPGGRRRTKGNMAVEIATELVNAAEHAEHILLFSGEGDLSYAVDAAQRKGAKVTVVSSLKVDPPAISDDLRRAADRFVDLADVKDLILRKEITPVPQGGAQERSSAVQVERRPLGLRRT